MQYEEFAKLWAPLMGISVNEGEAEAAETTDEAEEAQDVGDGSPPASLQRSIGDNGSKSSGLGSSRTGLSFADKISQSFISKMDELNTEQNQKLIEFLKNKDLGFVKDD